MLECCITVLGWVLLHYSIRVQHVQKAKRHDKTQNMQKDMRNDRKRREKTREKTGKDTPKGAARDSRRLQSLIV
jgi:hypothetical protein